MADKVDIIRKQDGSEYGRSFVCPGCLAWSVAQGNDPSKIDATHVIPTTGPKAWGYNGSLERPTFTPSVLVHEVKRTDGTVFSPRCHSVVTDGRIQYCKDSGHPLAGQTVELPEIKAP